MTASEDPSTSTLETVVEVYETPEEDGETRYAGLSRLEFGVAAVVFASHAVAFLLGHYAVSLGVLAVLLVAIATVAATRNQRAPRV